MRHDDLKLRNLNDLREYVYKSLCEQNDLELGVFQITERFLVRSGSPCGIFFCLHGPRSVRVTAIWETDNNMIRFYGSEGQKVLKTQLNSSLGEVLATP